MNEFSAFGAHSGSLAEALDQAILLYRRNFGRLVLIATLTFVPVAVLRLVVNLYLPSIIAIDGNDLFFRLLGAQNVDFLTLRYVVSLSIFMGLTLVLDFFGYTVAAAAMTDLCVKSLLGLKLSTWESLGAAWRIWLPLLGIFGLKLSIAFLLAVWALVPLVGWFTGPGALAIFLGNIIFLAVPVLILEKQSPMRSLWRAWLLVRRRYWWMVAFGIILFIFSQVGITGVKYLMIFLTSALIQVLQPALLDRIPNVVTQSFIFAIDSLTNLLYLPLYAMGAVTAYLYLRNKSEALDLIVALEGSPASSDLMAEVKVSDSTASRWPLTWREGGKFAIMTLSGTVGIAIFYTILFGSILAVAIFIIIFNNR